MTIEEILSMDNELYTDMLNLVIIKLQEKAKVIDDLKNKKDKDNNSFDDFEDIDRLTNFKM